MLAMSERVRPCSDLWFVSSDGTRDVQRVARRDRIVMPAGTRCDSSPFGPFTFTVLPSSVTVTPVGDRDRQLSNT